MCSQLVHIKYEFEANQEIMHSCRYKNKIIGNYILDRYHIWYVSLKKLTYPLEDTNNLSDYGIVNLFRQ